MKKVRKEGDSEENAADLHRPVFGVTDFQPVEHSGKKCTAAGKYEDDWGENVQSLFVLKRYLEIPLLFFRLSADKHRYTPAGQVTRRRNFNITQQGASGDAFMIMVKYQGQIESLNLVEEFEDHVMQTATALGSRAHLWRSSTKYSPGRLVRGLSLHLCPGQEAVSLLLSPEGLLIPEQAADEAIFAPLLQQPWCHVRTHCGGVDGHTALIELLELMKRSWFPDLVVLDVTGYWEHRNPQKLRQSFLEADAELHPRYAAATGIWLTSEAAEDASILLRRLDRLAQLVRAPHVGGLPQIGTIPERSEFARMSIDEAVLWADYALRQQALHSDRIRRIIEECLAIGMTAEEAAATALRREGRPADLPEPENDDLAESMAESVSAVDSEGDCDMTSELFAEADAEWTADVGSGLGDFADDDGYGADGASVIRDLLNDGASPLLQAARQLMLEIIPPTSCIGNRSGYLNVLHQGLLELVGALGQDVGDCQGAESDHYLLSFSIVHLKRAIKGAAFVTGAITGMRAERLLSSEQAVRWSSRVAEITSDLHQRVDELWQSAHTG